MIKIFLAKHFPKVQNYRMQNSMILQFISEHPWYSLFYTIGTYLFLRFYTTSFKEDTQSNITFLSWVESDIYLKRSAPNSDNIGLQTIRRKCLSIEQNVPGFMRPPKNRIITSVSEQRNFYTKRVTQLSNTARFLFRSRK